MTDIKTRDATALRDGEQAARKHQGDKFAAAVGGGTAPQPDRPGTGDSPKRQGDPFAPHLKTK